MACWTAQLRNARDSAEQIAALRAIRNEVIGHPLKKEMVVTQGILEPIVRLTTSRSDNQPDGKSHDHSFAAKPLVEEETIRLYGLQVIASIALGGPAFLVPLNSASALQAILSNLCPSNNPPQIVLASLRALEHLVRSAALTPNAYTLNTTSIADALFVRQHLGSLSQILSQKHSSSNVLSQINAAASLISKLCVEERYQHAIANSGILDSLATKLASFVAAEGLVIPGADHLAARDGLQEQFPSPAPWNASLSAILEAVATIIADSKLRAAQLLYSPSILAVFPTGLPTDYMASYNMRVAWNLHNGAPSIAKHSQLNALDYLLPCVPHPNQKSISQTTAFPPLGTSGSRECLALNGRAGSKHNGASLPTWGDSHASETGFMAQDGFVDQEEPESPLIPYLLGIIRAKDGLKRLMAVSVLTVFYRTGLTNNTRETFIGLLVIPLLLDLLRHDPITTDGRDSFTDEEIMLENRAVKEKAPAVLAMLITDSEYLQKAAFDAHAIPRLCSMLKHAYDPVKESSNPRPWTPLPEATSSLGDLGLSPQLVHNIKVRESTLKAIASIVPFKDEYRKAMVDEGVMPYIVESMKSEPRKPSKPTDKTGKSNESTDEELRNGYGVNPVSVIIAACGAVRALSRSVSILRTTLIDNGIAPPVIQLLRHSDIEIQIAATATMCNLVTDISPMRDMIIDSGVITILCEHAHSINARLRLNAVWSLKHFVNAVPNDLKRQCVEELGQGWLVQLICDDTEDEALLSSKEKSDKGVADEDTDEDMEIDEFEEQVDAAFTGSFGRSNHARPSSSHSKTIKQAELRLAALRDAEINPVRKARKDDIAIQEQALSFIRNLIGPTGPGASLEVMEMVDYLFSSLGQERIFEILSSKLRPKVINPYNRRSNAETRVQPPQPEIIIAVAMIIVHLAASVPRHRQIVIAQTELLKLLVPQFNHPNIEIRLALCHLATNLAWMDDASDSRACIQRAKELQNLDFLAKLEMLEQDSELNVRERAKSAVWQMKQSLGY